MTTRTKSRSQLIRLLDEVFSRYIRLRDADYAGYATCVTCGLTKPWKEQQCGHYESRAKYSTRWDERNCNVQCFRCNVALKGNYPAYARYMIKKYGDDILDILASQASNHNKITDGELDILIKDYRKKVKEMGYA